MEEAGKDALQELAGLAAQQIPAVESANVVAKAMGVFRRDVFRGLLADFILQSRESGGKRPRALAIQMRHLSPLAEALVRDYADRFQSRLNCLVVDAEGDGFVCRDGQCRSLEVSLRARHPAITRSIGGRGSLFSANSQWFLKVLLLDGVDGRYWGGPSSNGGIVGVSHLAELAGKPQPSVSHCVRALEAEGYVTRSRQGIRVQRIPQLLEQWAYYLLNHSDRVLPVQSLFPEEAVADVLNRLGGWSDAIVGGHTAARILGLGIATNESARIYVRDLHDALDRLELVAAESGQGALVLIRPRAEASVFGGAVGSGGLAVADALQVYLDLFTAPARGREREQHVYEQVLAPHWEKRGWL